jgi:hypothetical protein
MDRNRRIGIGVEAATSTPGCKECMILELCCCSCGGVDGGVGGMLGPSVCRTVADACDGERPIFSGALAGKTLLLILSTPPNSSSQACTTADRPKSAIFRVAVSLVSDRRRFSGLRSRCTIPLL